MTDFSSIPVPVDRESEADNNNFFAALINDLKTIIGSANHRKLETSLTCLLGIIKKIFHSNFITGKSKTLL